VGITMMQITRTKPALLFLALMTAATLAVGACGGDDKQDSKGGGGASAPQTLTERNRALLDALGSYPQAVVVREYVTAKGAVGREYGTFGDSSQPATEVTAFYRDKLKAQGWETTQEQTAVSAYSKGGQTLSITRYGATTPAPAPVQTTTVTARQAVELKFFFAIEVS
jgi:hypothetical protein